MAGHYRAIGAIINDIDDPEVRQRVADHFATAFRKRYPDGFDPLEWTRSTGGRIVGFDIRRGRFADGTR